MTTYRRGDIPSDLDPKLRRLMEQRERFLRSLSPKAPPRVQGEGDAEGSSGGSTLSKTTTSGLGIRTNMTDLSTLPLAPAGTRLHLRFTHLLPIATSDRVTLWRATWTPKDDKQVLTLVSDGTRWYQVAGGYEAATWFDCPVDIYQRESTCNPVFEIYPYNSTIQSVLSVWYDTGLNRYVSMDMGIVPGVDGVTGRGLYNNGGTNNEWRGTYSEAFYGRVINLEAGNVTVSGTLNNYNITAAAGAQFMVYRATATANTVISGILKPTITGNRTPLFDFINVSTGLFSVTFLNDSSGSDSDNRILIGGASSWQLTRNDTARFWYDGTTLKWRLLK